MEDQIAKTRSGDGKTEKRHSNADLKSMPIHHPRSWLLPVAVTGGVTAIGGAGFWWLLWTSHAFVNVVEGHTFLISGTLTLALLIVALVQACVYWSQRGIMRGQWEAMLQALGEAKEQTRIAGDSLVISTRSYVGLHSITLDPETKTVSIKIENIGHAPADHIEVFIEMLTSMPDDVVARNERVRAWQRIDQRRGFGEMQLFPGNLQIMIPVRLKAKLSDDELNLVLNGHGTLITRGVIDYADGFGSQKTRFFFLYEASGNAWTADAPESWADIFEGLGVPKEREQG